MKSKAEVDLKDLIHQKRLEYKFSKRKNMIQQIMMNKRINPSNQNDIVQQKKEYQEEIEDTKEDGEINWKLILTKHRKRTKRIQEGGVGTAEALTTT